MTAPPCFAYVGWNGRGNTGDDAMFGALAGRLGPLATFPVYARELAGAVLDGRVARMRRAHLLLGGGTLLGRSVWRKVLRYKALPLLWRRPHFVVGAGVEDPSFQGRHSFSAGGDELRRWPALLRGFHRVNVRGPRSAELLADVGVEARVVGDPALLLEPASETDVDREGVVGVTLGFGDDLWGHDHGPVEGAVAGCLRELMSAGWQVRLICMNDEDADRHGSLALGGQVSTEVASSPQAYVDAVAACQLTIAERLHAMVLSAAAGTPFVGLDYQPKCADFARSVGWQAWTVRTDEVDGASLSERVRGLVADGEARDVLAARVGTLRGELERATGEVRRCVLGA